MERTLARVYTCADSIAEALFAVAKKPRAAKFASIQRRKDEEFKRKMIKIRVEWLDVIDEIFKNLSDPTLYEDIAVHIIKSISSTKSTSCLDDDHCKLAIQYIVTPIIGMIMDERELSASSKKIQDNRIYLLLKMLTAKPSSPHNDQPNEGSTNENVSNNQASRNNSQQLCTEEGTISCSTVSVAVVEHYRWETTQILTLLFDALTRHTQVITKKDVDIISQVYHIMNITYIVDILMTYFNEMNQQGASSGGRHSRNIEFLEPEIIENFKDSIAKNLSMFEIDNPLSIFRADLRLLLCKIRLLNPI